MENAALAQIFAKAFGEPLPNDWETLSAEARDRLARLALASPLYARLLQQTPAWALWLEDERNLHTVFRYQALLQEWRAFAAAAGEPLNDDERYLERLRRWRRLMSLRIAYRSVNELASEKTTVDELTRLAEYCIRECYLLGVKRWAERLGEPWDDDLSRPARFCIMALGKLGGQELNFSSDVDLIFLYEGDGYCRPQGRPTATSTVEFFTKVAETTTRWLSAQTENGFLFRVDARLRPEGAAGPLVRSLSSMENYYAVAGQTWERLAWLKARPVCGDLALGAELLESLQSFRYPRHPPPSLITEVAAMKTRTERELVGTEALERNVKSGAGGIRDIEFVAQSLQLLHAGRYPFLQTHSTETALEQLALYNLLDAQQSKRLRETYWFLRAVEHRLQMREEQQTHTLPTDGATLSALALSLGFDGPATMETKLSETRAVARAAYEELFSDRSETDREFESWWTFFSTARTPDVVADKLQRWFGASPDAASQLRRFACGDSSRMVTREQVTWFQHLAATFDALMPDLARPALTLQRLSRFAERYGTRSHFFATCAGNPQFFRVLALLFDRSAYIHELLCAHPEIFDEVIRPEILRQRKDAAALRRDFNDAPQDSTAFAHWLPLFVRAEQVRYTIAELLGFISIGELGTALTLLADVTLAELCSREPELNPLLIVALGKYGGAELTCGSDLDVLFVTDEPNVADMERALRRVLTFFQGFGIVGAPFTIDSRLRPHGEAGPLIATLDAFKAYHASGGSAQLWERQMLTRARTVVGPEPLRQAWETFVAGRVDQVALTTDELDEIWRMRLRIQNERDIAQPPERAFKTAAGGLVDFEFFAQIERLRPRPTPPELRASSTRAGLVAALKLKQTPEAVGQELLQNYDFLKRIEVAVRRDENRAVSVLPGDLAALAHWLSFPSAEAFFAEHRRRMAWNRETLKSLLFGPVPDAHPTAD